MKQARLNLAVKNFGEMALVEASGEIDQWTFDIFDEAVRNVVEDGSDHVILDLTRVTSMDAGAIRFLLEACKALGSERRMCAVARGGPERLIRMTRLDSVMPVFTAVADAGRALEVEGANNDSRK